MNTIYQIISQPWFLPIITAIFAGLWQYRIFVKKWNFENYHKLIKELNQSDTPGEPIKLYRQVAVVYELRNYPRYFSVSKRILGGWLDEDSFSKNHPVLAKEMRLSVEFMDNPLKCLFLCIKEWLTWK